MMHHRRRADRARASTTHRRKLQYSTTQNRVRRFGATTPGQAGGVIAIWGVAAAACSPPVSPHPQPLSHAHAGRGESDSESSDSPAPQRGRRGRGMRGGRPDSTLGQSPPGRANPESLPSRSSWRLETSRPATQPHRPELVEGRTHHGTRAMTRFSRFPPFDRLRTARQPTQG